MIDGELILQWLQALAGVLEQNRQYLTDLDAETGDADHGANMDRGFKKVAGLLPGMKGKDIGSILKSTGMALISSVGGAGGPLYGTFFLRAAAAADGKQTLSDQDLAALLAAGLEGVVQRGKAQVGDKTMVDALMPAVQAFEEAVGDGNDTAAALAACVSAAEAGMRSTIPLLARKGRASYLGKRSIGHQDPGATSSYLMLKALLDVVSRPV